MQEVSIKIAKMNGTQDDIFDISAEIVVSCELICIQNWISGKIFPLATFSRNFVGLKNN